MMGSPHPHCLRIFTVDHSAMIRRRFVLKEAEDSFPASSYRSSPDCRVCSASGNRVAATTRAGSCKEGVVGVRSASTVTIIASAKWSEELAKVVREHRRLFGSWKMPPRGELVPPRDVEMAFRERSRCGRHADALVGEHCDPGWDLDAVLLEEGRRPSHRVIRLERGDGCTGHPVNGERREDPLERKSTDRPTSTVAPRPVLLEEPRSEADRRVRQGISERPRFGPLDVHVRTFGGP